MFLCVSCTDQDNAKRVLEFEGVTNIEFTGYDWFGCGKDDTFHTGFKGIKNNRQISGVVCSGILKGSTVRYH